MDIIFWTGLYGHAIYRPIGAYQLSHWMRKHGYSCQVIDFMQTMPAEEIIEFTEKFITTNTLCIGLSSTFWSTWNKHIKRWVMSDSPPPEVVVAMKEIKKRYPHIRFVLGGSQSDVQQDDTYQLFDAVITGNGEDSFLEVCEEWRKGNKQVFATSYRGGTPYFEESLNKVFDPVCNNHMFEINDCIIPGETLPIEISRGCIFSCKFCQYPHIGKKKNDYIRNMDLIKQEIEYNKRTFNSDKYYILDDTFNDSHEKMQNWGSMLKDLDFDIKYTSYLRADLLSRNPEQIEIFRDTGMVSAMFGIESFDPQGSMLVGKGWSGKEAKTFLPDLMRQWKNDITFHISMIVGIPPETYKDYRIHQDWCIENKIPSWVWQILGINTKPRTFESEFDRNYKKYGFELTNPGVTRDWKTAYMDSKEAARIATTLNGEPAKNDLQKMTCWVALAYMSLGYSHEYLNNVLEKDFNYKELYSKQNAFVAEYKRLLRNL